MKSAQSAEGKPEQPETQARIQRKDPLACVPYFLLRILLIACDFLLWMFLWHVFACP